MSYLTKEECYSDILISLTTGIIEETDLSILRYYYEQEENYECCQGLVEAYVDYKKAKDVTTDKSISRN